MLNTLLWIEAQFYTLGFTEEASDLSLDLMCKLQGAFLLAYALKDSNLIVRQVALLQDFIRQKMPEKTNALLESA